MQDSINLDISYVFLRLNLGTLARLYLGFQTAGRNRNSMQRQPSSTHIHIIHCSAANSSPTKPSELLHSARPQSTLPATQPGLSTAPAQSLPLTDTYGQKKSRNLKAYVSHSWSRTRRGSRGDTFPDGFSPILVLNARAKCLQLSSHTSV